MNPEVWRKLLPLAAFVTPAALAYLKEDEFQQKPDAKTLVGLRSPELKALEDNRAVGWKEAQAQTFDVLVIGGGATGRGLRARRADAGL